MCVKGISFSELNSSLLRLSFQLTENTQRECNACDNFIYILCTVSLAKGAGLFMKTSRPVNKISLEMTPPAGEKRLILPDGRGRSLPPRAESAQVSALEPGRSRGWMEGCLKHKMDE